MCTIKALPLTRHPGDEPQLGANLFFEIGDTEPLVTGGRRRYRQIGAAVLQ